MDTMTTEQLKAEIERLKVERDLAVRVAVSAMDEFVYHSADRANDSDEFGTLTYGDVKKVIAWNKELTK